MALLTCDIILLGFCIVVFITDTDGSGGNPSADNLLGDWGSYINRWSGLV